MKVTYAKYGDRWDLLAYDLLGDAALAPQLMAANEHLSGLVHIPQGTKVIIPEASKTTNQITKIKPPWQS